MMGIAKDMKFYLAPMEGLTTYTFRTVWNQYYGGADTFFTPFIANRQLNSRERNDILPEHNVGMHTIPQILTNKADEFLELAEVIAQYGYEEVNLNLGCPSGTVVARKRGAGFLGVPKELDAFLDEIFTKCPLRISVKTRIGVQDDSEWDTLLSVYEKYPIAELTIHPRLQVQGYQGRPNREAYAKAVLRLSCPLCYNGDINSAEDLASAGEVLAKDNAVMIGRGILRNPMLFRQLRGENTGSREERLDTFREYHRALLAGYESIMSGDTNTLFKMKDLWTFFGQNFEASEKELKQIRKAKTVSEYRIAVQMLLQNCPMKE